MTSSIFLVLAGIKGGTQVDAYKSDDAIDVLAWSWGASNSGTTHVGQGSGGGSSAFMDLSVTKEIDKASPTMMSYLASGKHIPEGRLICTRSGNDTSDAYVEYLVIEFKDAIFTSRSLGGSNGERMLTENWSINFGSFKETYSEQNADGTKGTDIPIEWDIAAKKASF